MTNMKIVLTDNFDRETKSEKLICANVPACWAQEIADFLNAKHNHNGDSDFWAKVTPDDYKLYEFIP